MDINTVKRVLGCEEGVDPRTIERLFNAFDLELIKSYYTKPSPNKHLDWGEATNLSSFHGRDEELNTLESLLMGDRCRLVTILGMGGIGKTALSIKFAQQVERKFNHVIWRSLRDSPPINELLTNLIESLSEGQENEADLPESVGGKITCIINYLRSFRCLLVLDNVESILCSNNNIAGSCREGYEGYEELFRRIGATQHQSSLLLTTREKPKQIAALEGEAFKVRTLRINGLKQKEGVEILKEKELSGTENQFQTIIKRYAGNALALKIVATTINDLFAGDIAEFLAYNTSVFGDIRNLLEQQFARLSETETEIIFWLTINREPTKISELREDLVSSIGQSRLLEGLESLSRRSLIEQNAASFTVQSVVMEYAADCLIEKITQEVVAKKLDFCCRYALVKATAKDYIRETQIRVILQPLSERLLNLFQNQKNLEAQLREIIVMMQETSPREPGYAAGNILNLFCHLDTDLKGYDFSNLCVWQADLRCTTLHSVNFQNADLSKTLFAENFGGIWSVAFSPDGQYLAAGDTKGDIILRRKAMGH